ncbi:NADH:ubiquinone oxidoreductase complex I intermediate-associated protein 30 [Martensiomyces pterosporus]|nr:NADH:ubiquinone oxidoreductase complex I intermediate-associated protein 30 [Martensiomyces pterosporus]
MNRQTEFVVASVNSKRDLQDWVKGSDRDINGFSDAWLDITKDGHAKFHGYISQKLPEDVRFKRSGYAMVRTRDPQSNILTNGCWDSSLFRYLALRVKADRRKYFVNLKSESLIPTDIYQHLLPIRTPGRWETVVIPFSMFTLTSNSVIVASQPSMASTKMETVGFSISDRQEGPFALEFAWIKAFNSIRTFGECMRLPYTSELTWRTDFARLNKDL